MSIFDDNNEDIKRSIGFFNQLSDEDKVTIVSDLNPQTFKLKRYYKPLFPLLSKIQKDISKFDAIKIGNKLMEYGLDETYARLFVTNMKKHAPTEDYQLNQLDKIADDLFCDNLPEIIKNVWVDHVDNNMIVEKFSITQEQVDCIIDVTRNLLNSLARGETTKALIKEKYAKKISEKKLSILMDKVSIHSKHWHDTMLFSNVQDTFFNTERIVKQNEIMLRFMKELIGLIREQKTRQ